MEPYYVFNHVACYGILLRRINYRHNPSSISIVALVASKTRMKLVMYISFFYLLVRDFTMARGMKIYYSTDT